MATIMQVGGGNGGAKFYSITLPAGRMRGDMDGDGRFTQNDYDLVLAHQNDQTGLDAATLWALDVTGDGKISSLDTVRISAYVNGTKFIGQSGNDYTGNWTANPNYATEPGQFYKDFAVPGVTASNSALLIVLFEGVTKVVCLDGYVRVFVSLVPIADVDSTLIIFPGGGSGAVAMASGYLRR